jgi:uncharacterized protein (DUF58 family)
MIVKLFRQEVCPHLDVVLDGSRSMDLPGSEKGRAAAGVAAALATAADNAGHSHRAFLAGQGCQPIGNGAAPPTLWQGVAFDSNQSPPEAFRTLSPPWRPHGVRALVSDLLWLGDPLELLGAMSGGAAAVYVIEVLAAADLVPDQIGNLRLADSESDLVEEAFLDATSRARYCDNLERHREAWRRAARQTGALFASLVAEQVVARWDLSPLVEVGMLSV